MKLAGLAILLVTNVALAQATGPSAPPIPDQATLEREFERTMTGATLVGGATVGGRDGTNPREDRYVIQRVSKITDPAAAGDGDRWLIVWRAKIGGRDVPVPLAIPVKWAGDTPVISVTDMAIPGMGTYTARVIIYRDSYAGTWSGHGTGGHLWGRIERAGSGTTTTPATTRPVSP
jgi:hypothetical protein